MQVVYIVVYMGLWKPDGHSSKWHGVGSTDIPRLHPALRSISRALRWSLSLKPLYDVPSLVYLMRDKKQPEIGKRRMGM